MKKDSASSTAYTVIHGILHVAKDPKLKHLIDIDTLKACNTILSVSSLGRKCLAELHHPLKQKTIPLLEWLLMPGITLNYVLRKKFIQEKVLEAINNGTKQVINIGAGLDTLAWQLSTKFPEVSFIEIDHPATSIEKVKAIKTPSTISTNLHFLQADLSKVSLEDTLLKCENFDTKEQTLYISEGVLMYLDEIHVSRVFNSLRDLTGSGSLFVFSCLEPYESDKNNIRPLLYLYLQLKNERYLWYKRDTKISFFLQKHRYTLIEMADSEIYKQKYLSSKYHNTLHKGEYIVVAKVD